ncbi:dihydrofolate reductase family protein [Myroides odoratimimus]|uniref:dihydrofolate reductase family protein n=1 Tax=Myroides odoratimimus TaxID=76832 RepID=UPI0025752784|nr:dihydrofolate reductase family protein [Myroides odoratimimus]MDM1527924.1 dihydrofolate reductase [Myroides odoratimimus]
MRQVVLYISSSLDGYIAKAGDDLSFLDAVQREGEDYGYTAFVEKIDTVLIGKRTYDWVVSQGHGFHHADKETYVMTRQNLPTEGNVTFYNGDLKELVSKLKSQEGKDIFCDGGALLVNRLLKDGLIDKIVISVIPVLLGEGTRLFDIDIPESKLKLESTKSFESGLVQLCYSLIK